MHGMLKADGGADQLLRISVISPGGSPAEGIYPASGNYSGCDWYMHRQRSREVEKSRSSRKRLLNRRLVRLSCINTSAFPAPFLPICNETRVKVRVYIH